MSVRRIALGSLAKVGCLLGVVAAFLPSLLCGLLGTGAAVLLQGWLESWQEAAIRFDLPLLGEQVFTFDLVRLLHVEGLLSFLDTVTAVSGVTFVLVVLALAVLSGLLLAVIVTLVGLAYNLIASAIGGLVVEMKPLPGPERPQTTKPSEPPRTG